jgi:hypothetical protein
MMLVSFIALYPDIGSGASNFFVYVQLYLRKSHFLLDFLSQRLSRFHPISSTSRNR